MSPREDTPTASGPGGGVPPRPRGPRGPAPGGPGGHALVQPTARAKDFKGTMLRLAGELRPERALLVIIVVLAVASVAFAVVGPRILGH
ncbi:MAG TPA: ABC transporter ATP-binding protein, partial [Thermoleophilia bacterium]|nr:ABC transporter ATP-binding protein [Thermoleophilia bacterium]